MPLSIPVITKYLTHTFVETGTYQGEAVQFAIQTGYREIHSVELNADMAAGCKARFKGNPAVHIYAGSSGVVLAGVLKTCTGPATIWLDAHPIIPKLTLAQVPIEAELKAIAEAMPRLQIRAVLIDDMRVFSVEDQQWMEARLREILPTATICRESHHIATNDILVASMLPAAGQ